MNRVGSRVGQDVEFALIDMNEVREGDVLAKHAQIGEMFEWATAVVPQEPVGVRGIGAHMGRDAQPVLVGQCLGRAPDIVRIGRMPDQQRPGRQPCAAAIWIARDLRFQNGDGVGRGLGLVGAGIEDPPLDPLSDAPANAGLRQALHDGVELAHRPGLEETGGPSPHHGQRRALGRHALFFGCLGAE